MILAGDIGGTNTRLALFEKGAIVAEEKFPSREFKSLEEIVKQFLKVKVAAACFGIAGPIRDGRCKATNLPWIVDIEVLKKELQIPRVHLLNDLEANAYGLKVLKSDELYCLQQGKRQVGNQALIAAGTGLGEAGLFWDGKAHCPFATEGGHTDFAPRNELESELLMYLKKKYEHVSYERVVSGPGIHAIYQFLIDTKRETASPQITSEIQKRDPGSVINEFSLKDKACSKAIDWFLSLYGAEAGNMALKYLSLGGFYIGGGIAPRLKDRFKQSEFLSSFSNKGRFKELLQSMPIHIVLNDKTALLGAAAFAGSQ